MQIDLVGIVASLVMFGALWLGIRHAQRIAHADINEWARQNNLEVANLRWAPPWRMPFESLPNRSAQTRSSFQADLIDANGKTRKAWIAYHTLEYDLFTKDYKLPKVLVAFRD